MNPAELFHIAAAERSFWWYRGMREILFDTLDRFRGGRMGLVLDAGCGTGANARDMADRYGWQVVGLDVCPVSVQWLRTRGVLGLLGDVTALPLQTACCEAVVSLDLLVHLKPGEEAAALAEFARVVRPGGLLVVRAAAFSWLRSRHSRFIGESQRFTRPQLLRLAADNGFQPLFSTYLNGLALPLAIARFRLWEPLFDRQPGTGVAALPRWLDSILLACLRLERAWLGRGHQLPIGQSILLVAQRRM